ncbi:leucine-rich_repeat domain-containing protein [Hexamita inflata]|uniref:Leucine-rich repeat domain-containing protein n=1 Tax=Hexamita inflata TaxID=28002 RepID=A0AA86NYC2_9EUKA|nr:leucine-rich repeat domain-containing protein [Hexamita inflata]
MQHVIRNKEDLLNHFCSCLKLEIDNLQQTNNLLAFNIPPGVWEDALNRNLLSFSQEFVQKTIEFTFDSIQIEHIYLISFLTNLSELNLSDNKISDISSISKLNNLKKLYLNNNRILDISALQFLPDLTHLYLKSNQLTSYTLSLPNLVDLKLGFNSLQDKSGLQHSPKLERLNLSATKTTDLRTIPHQLFGLKNLELYRNSIMEISYLSNFVDLQILDLSYNQKLQNIGPLKFCTQLTELSIHDTSVVDIWPLQFLKNLKILYMYQTQVIDLHPLQRLYQLQCIFANDTCIIDVSPFSKLTQLLDLSIWNSNITNTETLKHHNNYSKYRMAFQKVPTTGELKFYNKILSVHRSYKQIRKIQAENRISKFKELMTHQKQYINVKINEQIRVINKKIEIIFSHISIAYQ